jgi:hypothetical protein
MRVELHRKKLSLAAQKYPSALALLADTALLRISVARLSLV